MDVVPAGDGNDRALYFRDNAGGKYYNSIFTEFNGVGVKVEDIEGQDSRQQLEDGNLVLSNNYWWNFGAGNNLEGMSEEQFVRDYLADNNNSIEDPQFNSLSWEENGDLDPRISESSPAASGAAAMDDPFFMNTNYHGAFAPDAALWYEGWSALYQYGFSVEVVSDLEDDKDVSSVPNKFSLEQNYPNPFNPATKIQYALAEAGKVKLAVYNILGQQVAVLVDEFKNAGTHKIDFNAQNLTSGVYIYRLETNNKVFSRKMTLLK
jgi:hypothetical protein